MKSTFSRNSAPPHDATASDRDAAQIAEASQVVGARSVSGTSPGLGAHDAQAELLARCGSRSRVAPSFGIESPPVATTSDAQSKSRGSSRPRSAARARPPRRGSRDDATHARAAHSASSISMICARAAVAEELAELLLVIARCGGARRARRSRRACSARAPTWRSAGCAEMKFAGRRVKVREVAAPAAGDRIFLPSRWLCSSTTTRRPRRPPRSRRTAPRPRPDDDHVRLRHQPRRRAITKNAASAASIPTKSAATE